MIPVASERSEESSPRQVAQPIRDDSRFQMTKDQALTTGVEDEGSAQSQPVTEHACEQAATASAEPSAAWLDPATLELCARAMCHELGICPDDWDEEDGVRTYRWQKETACAAACLWAAHNVPAFGWQPIESAPRDGMHILVCRAGAGGFGYCGPLNDQGFRSRQDWADVAHWYEEPGHAGFYSSSWGGDQEEPFSGLTHWLPIPSPPLSAKDTSDGKEIPGNPKLNNAETPPSSPSDSAEGECSAVADQALASLRPETQCQSEGGGA